MLKIVKRVISIAFIPVQLYLGYLTYQNITAPKQNPQVNTQIIKEEVHSSTETGQTETQSESVNQENQENQENLPNDHPKIFDLSPEATVNGLTIGRTTTSQAMAALGQPMTIHQGSVYIYENINLYFNNNVLDGFIFPGPNGGFSSNHSSSPLKTSSGLTLGTPLQKVFEKYGPKTVLGSDRIIYRDKTNGYVLNISHKDNLITAIEVSKKQKTP